MSLIKKLLLALFFIVFIAGAFIFSAERNTKLQWQYWMQDRFTAVESSTLFVGSSTIARFPSEMAPSCGIIAIRGFENGLVSHVQTYMSFADLSKWQNIVIYTGENDIAYGANVNELLSSVEALLILTQTNTAQRVAFMSVKDSPVRAKFHQGFADFNTRLEQIISKYEHASIIPLHEIQSPLQFARDGVHLNELGYNLLSSFVSNFCQHSVVAN